MDKILEQQRRFFNQGLTRDVKFRLAQLKILKKNLPLLEDQVLQAIKRDFGKPEFESYISEFGQIKKEIDFFIRHLRSWSRPEKRSSILLNFPSFSEIRYEPYGLVLIISPWNLPFHLAMLPLIGALAAGNCVVLKPSELSANTSRVIAGFINNLFDKSLVFVIEGGVETSQMLLKERWDYIFFTGSKAVGKIVAQQAARNLIPCTLELGGKSPVIVTAQAHLKNAAKRIVWAKFFTGGQTCIAPDFVLAHESVYENLLQEMKAVITRFYGPDPSQSPDYSRIINKHHWQRIKDLIGAANVCCGGETNPEQLYIAPTILRDTNWSDPVMAEEIFGPVLPVIRYREKDEIVAKLQQMEKPLAAYIFSESAEEIEYFLKRLLFGGGVVNDALVHYVNHHLPFGGVGQSGFGRYHGKESFLTFSHAKAVVHRWRMFDLPLRYPPYTAVKFKFLKMLFDWL